MIKHDKTVGVIDLVLLSDGLSVKTDEAEDRRASALKTKIGKAGGVLSFPDRGIHEDFRCKDDALSPLPWIRISLIIPAAPLGPVPEQISTSHAKRLQ